MTETPASAHTPDVLPAIADARAGLGAEETTAAAPPFEAIYQQHFDFVWRLVRRFGTPDASVDDVVQDVFLVVHRQLPGFEGRSSLRTWLYGITRRVVSDHRKRRHRRRETAMDEAPAMEAPRGDPEVSAQQTQAVALLHQLLEGLPEDQREVFVLSELEQMSAPEIVELTGAKLNTVYSRLRLARSAFERGLARARSEGSPHRGDS